MSHTAEPETTWGLGPHWRCRRALQRTPPTARYLSPRDQPRPSLDRAGQYLASCRVAAWRADLPLPLPQKVDHGLLVPETGVDLSTCYQHVSLLQILDECAMTGPRRTAQSERLVPHSLEALFVPCLD